MTKRDDNALDTDAFYRASCNANFVKVSDIARNIAWMTPTAWGDLEITINLSKPEKDPRAIAAAVANTPQKPAANDYVDPATGFARPCPLCVTQADLDCGYARRIQLGGQPWGLWYSPYAYYDEHCIAMSWEHRRMHIDRRAFECLFDAVDLLPQYFFGSNADLPIVGGSILGHDHFQGGRHTFPMQKAPLAQCFELPDFPALSCGIVKWPLSVIRLESHDRAQLIDAACAILNTWVRYDDPAVGIVSGFTASEAMGGIAAVPGPTAGHAEGTGARAVMATGRTDGADPRTTAAADEGVAKVHNTITPILRAVDDKYQLDLALRCNITSDEHPLGVFHPHEELHHIKKENIGLIEVMGLAILPPRVRQTMTERNLSRDDVGHLFAQVLECAGVFKWDASGRAALDRFLGRVRAC